MATTSRTLPRLAVKTQLRSRLQKATLKFENRKKSIRPMTLQQRDLFLRSSRLTMLANRRAAIVKRRERQALAQRARLQYRTKQRPIRLRAARIQKVLSFLAASSSLSKCGAGSSKRVSSRQQRELKRSWKKVSIAIAYSTRARRLFRSAVNTPRLDKGDPGHWKYSTQSKKLSTDSKASHVCAPSLLSALATNNPLFPLTSPATRRALSSRRFPEKTPHQTWALLGSAARFREAMIRTLGSRPRLPGPKTLIEYWRDMRSARIYIQELRRYTDYLSKHDSAKTVELRVAGDLAIAKYRDRLEATHSPFRSMYGPKTLVEYWAETGLTVRFRATLEAFLPVKAIFPARALAVISAPTPQPTDKKKNRKSLQTKISKITRRLRRTIAAFRRARAALLNRKSKKRRKLRVFVIKKKAPRLHLNPSPLLAPPTIKLIRKRPPIRAAIKRLLYVRRMQRRLLRFEQTPPITLRLSAQKIKLASKCASLLFAVIRFSSAFAPKRTDRHRRGDDRSLNIGEAFRWQLRSLVHRNVTPTVLQLRKIVAFALITGAKRSTIEAQEKLRHLFVTTVSTLRTSTPRPAVSNDSYLTHRRTAPRKVVRTLLATSRYHTVGKRAGQFSRVAPLLPKKWKTTPFPTVKRYLSDKLVGMRLRLRRALRTPLLPPALLPYLRRARAQAAILATAKRRSLPRTKVALPNSRAQRQALRPRTIRRLRHLAGHAQTVKTSSPTLVSYAPTVWLKKVRINPFSSQLIAPTTAQSSSRRTPLNPLYTYRRLPLRSRFFLRNLRSKRQPPKWGERQQSLRRQGDHRVRVPLSIVRSRRQKWFFRRVLRIAQRRFRRGQRLPQKKSHLLRAIACRRTLANRLKRRALAHRPAIRKLSFPSSSLLFRRRLKLVFTSTEVGVWLPVRYYVPTHGGLAVKVVKRKKQTYTLRSQGTRKKRVALTRANRMRLKVRFKTNSQSLHFRSFCRTTGRRVGYLRGRGKSHSKGRRKTRYNKQIRVNTLTKRQRYHTRLLARFKRSFFSLKLKRETDTANTFTKTVQAIAPNKSLPVLVAAAPWLCSYFQQLRAARSHKPHPPRHSAPLRKRLRALRHKLLRQRILQYHRALARRNSRRKQPLQLPSRRRHVARRTPRYNHPLYRKSRLLTRNHKQTMCIHRRIARGARCIQRNAQRRPLRDTLIQKVTRRLRVRAGRHLLHYRPQQTWRHLLSNQRKWWQWTRAKRRWFRGTKLHKTLIFPANSRLRYRRRPRFVLIRPKKSRTARNKSMARKRVSNGTPRPTEQRKIAHPITKVVASPVATVQPALSPVAPALPSTPLPRRTHQYRPVRVGQEDTNSYPNSLRKIIGKFNLELPIATKGAYTALQQGVLRTRTQLERMDNNTRPEAELRRDVELMNALFSRHYFVLTGTEIDKKAMEQYAQNFKKTAPAVETKASLITPALSFDPMLTTTPSLKLFQIT